VEKLTIIVNVEKNQTKIRRKIIMTTITAINLPVVNLLGSVAFDLGYGSIYRAVSKSELGEYELQPVIAPSITFITNLQDELHDLYFITEGEFKALESLKDKIGAIMSEKPDSGGLLLSLLIDEHNELIEELSDKYKGHERVEGGIHGIALAEELADKNKYLPGVGLNIWQGGPNSITLRLTNPTTGRSKLTSVEHRNARKGEHKARTHNNLFGMLKSFLEDSGKWEEQ
jgi:hypothetical protein